MRTSAQTRRVATRRMASLLGLVFATGCATVGVQDQRLLSKPSMQFSKSAVYSYSSQLMQQIQPGLALSGGAQASTCSICR
jgi:hypothetical protein